MRREIALRSLGAAVVLVAALVAGAGVASAYPQFQFSSGTTRCRDCHYAPAGGGLLTEWGRGELGDTLSMGGDGAFLHGVPLPSWLDLGADLRLAGLINDVGSAEGAEKAIFPMQIEAAARVAASALSVTAVVGLRGATREPTGAAKHAFGFISREHFATYAPEAGTWYVRAGRFAAPFGLRLVDHTAYVRRWLGYGLYEETYGLGVGLLGEQSELHATAFVSDPVQWSLQPAVGGALLYEHRRDTTALLLSGRLAVGELDTRAIGDVAGKWWLESPSVLLMGELAAGWQRFPDADSSRPLGALYLGPVWFPTRGVSVSAAAEGFAEDLRIPEVARYGASAALTVLPWAHVEIALSGRYQIVGPDDHAAMALLQLHYFP